MLKRRLAVLLLVLAGFAGSPAASPAASPAKPQSGTSWNILQPDGTSWNALPPS
jgi:hypothetical protein